MTAMKRLCDGELSADAARILRSADADVPTSPDAQQARIIEAYGVVPPTLLASGIAFDGGRRRKWAVAAGGFLVATAVLVGWSATHRGAEPHSTMTAHTARPPIPSEPKPPQASEPTVRVEDLPGAPAVVTTVSAPRPAPAVAVEDELAAIDASRAALRTGRPAEALARIASCRSQFPHPLYAEEADALEVQALSALGRRDEARTKAALFFRAHPDSAYERRIRAAIVEVQP